MSRRGWRDIQSGGAAARFEASAVCRWTFAGNTIAATGDLALGEGLRRALGEAGYKCWIARDAVTALAVLSGSHPLSGPILLDTALADMDWFELALRVGIGVPQEFLPILLIETVDEQRALFDTPRGQYVWSHREVVGLETYFLKPVDVREVAMSVDLMVSRARSAVERAKRGELEARARWAVERGARLRWLFHDYTGRDYDGDLGAGHMPPGR